MPSLATGPVILSLGTVSLVWKIHTDPFQSNSFSRLCSQRTSLWFSITLKWSWLYSVVSIFDPFELHRRCEQHVYYHRGWRSPPVSLTSQRWQRGALTRAPLHLQLIRLNSLGKFSQVITSSISSTAGHWTLLINHWSLGDLTGENSANEGKKAQSTSPAMFWSRNTFFLFSHLQLTWKILFPLMCLLPVLKLNGLCFT